MSDYYTVPINTCLLEKYGYTKNEYGRYEKMADPMDNSFERFEHCPKCGGEIIGYKKIICSNGMLQIRILCEGSKQSGCCSAKQKESGKEFAKTIRR